MMGILRDPRGAVMAWTVFTTVFLWTPTMRMLFKPEVSRWKVGPLEGSGRSELWWVFPLLALLALFMFYLNGRGRLRALFHALLLAWHLPLTALVVYGAVSRNASFHGGAWGVEIPLLVLSLPFLAGSALAIAWGVKERRGAIPVPVADWSDVRWGILAVALLLFPIAIAFYRAGEGFDWIVRTGIVTSVVQWILLAQGLEGNRHGSTPVEGSLTTPEASLPNA